MIQSNNRSSAVKIENLGLKELFITNLKELLWIENEGLKILPYLKMEVISEELRTGIDEHLDISEIHQKRLKEIFSIMKIKTEARTSYAFEGLRKDIERIIIEVPDPETKDAAAIRIMTPPTAEIMKDINHLVILHVQIPIMGCRKEKTGTLAIMEIVHIKTVVE
jgi:hypothetical protein